MACIEGLGVKKKPSEEGLNFNYSKGVTAIYP
jgi:hypothetical protein